MTKKPNNHNKFNKNTLQQFFRALWKLLKPLLFPLLVILGIWLLTQNVFGANSCATINEIKQLDNGNLEVEWTLNDKSACGSDRTFSVTSLHFSDVATTSLSGWDLNSFQGTLQDETQSTYAGATWHGGGCNDAMQDVSTYTEGQTYTSPASEYLTSNGATSTTNLSPGDTVYFQFWTAEGDSCNSVGDRSLDTEGYTVQADVNKINLTFPQDNSTTTQFADWGIEATLSGSATSTANTSDQDAYVIQAYTGLATSTSAQFLDNSSTVNISPGETLNLDLPKNTELTPQTWYGQAKLVYVNIDTAQSSVVATSTFNSFEVIRTGESGFYDPGTSTSTELTITCDPDSPFFERSFCNLYQALFVPDPSNVRQFQKLDDGIREKAPWGYIVIIQDELEKIKATSTESYTAQVPDNFPIFDKAQDITTIFLWVLFGFWIIKRFRKIQ